MYADRAAAPEYAAFVPSVMVKALTNRSGSIASRNFSPPALYVLMSNSPIATATWYDAIGSVAFQVHVVQPPELEVFPGMPLATAWSPAGTVISKEYDAASEGWSLTGNQVAAECGCPTITTPSSLGTTPYIPMTRSTSGEVTPEYRTTVVNDDAFRIPSAGVMINSWPDLENVAVCLSTVIERTSRPFRSRSNVGQVLGRHRRDRRHAVDRPGRRVELERQVVVGDVVPPVPIEREVRIAGTRAPRREHRWTRLRSRRSGPACRRRCWRNDHQHCGDRHDHWNSHRKPPVHHLR